MPRQLAESTINKRVAKFIANNKYLNDPKYYKNNRWSIAAWDSWAAQGKAGGCATCNNKFYNATLTNKRVSHDLCKQISGNLCYSCKEKVIIAIGNIKFEEF